MVMSLLSIIPACASTPSMLAAVPVPSLSAGVPMPAWWGIFSGLLVVTFAVHLVFMNATLGSGVLLVAAPFARKGGYFHWLTGEVMDFFPVAISLTITTGVAPLLFAQVLYPQFFYTASILIAAYWLLILGFLIVGFYCVYIAQRVSRNAGGGGRLLWFLLAIMSAVAFLSIAYLFTNQAIAVIEPDRWQVLLDGEKTLHIRSPQFLPRLLHTFVGATAVFGLYLAAIGQFARARQGESERGPRVVRAGMRLAIGATFVQVAIGLWFLLAVDEGPRAHLYNPAVGGAGSVAWMVGIAAALLGLWLMVRALLSPDNWRWTAGACGAVFATLLGMSAGRETLRLGYLSPYLAKHGFPPAAWTPRWQTVSAIIFLVTFAIGLGVLWMLVRWWWQLPPAPSETQAAQTPASSE